MKEGVGWLSLFKFNKVRYHIQVQKYFTLKKISSGVGVDDLIEEYPFKYKNGTVVVTFKTEGEAEAYLKRFVRCLYNSTIGCYYADGGDGIYNEEYGYFHYLYRIVRDEDGS